MVTGFMAREVSARHELAALLGISEAAAALAMTCAADCAVRGLPPVPVLVPRWQGTLRLVCAGRWRVNVRPRT